MASSPAASAATAVAADAAAAADASADRDTGRTPSTDPSVDTLYRRRLDRSIDSPLSGIARLHDEDRMRVYGLRAVLAGAKEKLQRLQDAVDDRDREIERERDLRQSLEDRTRKRLVDMYQNPALLDELHARLPRASKARLRTRSVGSGDDGVKGAGHDRDTNHSDGEDARSPRRAAAGVLPNAQQSQPTAGPPPFLPATVYLLLPPQQQQQQYQPLASAAAVLPAAAAAAETCCCPGGHCHTHGAAAALRAPLPGAGGHLAPASLSAGQLHHAHLPSPATATATKGQEDLTYVKLMGDHSRQTSRLLVEIDALKTLNRTLADELREAQQEVERLTVERQLSSAATEAQLAERAAALVEEVYEAQRERDEAVLGRLRLANLERDDALQRLAAESEGGRTATSKSRKLPGSNPAWLDGDHSAATIAAASPPLGVDSTGQDFSKLLQSFREADSAQKIEETTSSVLDLLRDSHSQHRQVVSREMSLVIEERNAALGKCKQLELETLQLHRALDEHASVEASERKLRAKLLAVQQERDVALSRVARLEDELQNVKIYYSLHKSLSQEASLRDQYSDSLRRLEDELRRSRDRDEALSAESARLAERCAQLDDDRRTLLAQLGAERSAAAQAAEREQRLQRLVAVLRRKLQGISAIGTDTEEAYDDAVFAAASAGGNDRERGAASA